MYVEMKQFLTALAVTCPDEARTIALEHRKVRHGLLPVGLKLHFTDYFLAENTIMRLVSALGGRKPVLEVNFYRQSNAFVCLVLPPVGSAKCAIQFLECIGKYCGVSIFNNPAIQIQVCNPQRLNPEYAGILTYGFYTGSDIIREYLYRNTTFSQDTYITRGERLVIYDGRGALDRDFCIWMKQKSTWWAHRIGPLAVARLPFKKRRTDVLNAMTKVDIHNINLIATLLVHAQSGYFWRELGLEFASEMKKILGDHLLSLDMVPWVHDDKDKGINPTVTDEETYARVIGELVSYAMAEWQRLYAHPDTGIGLLGAVNDLLGRYRRKVVEISQKFSEVEDDDPFSPAGL